MNKLNKLDPLAVRKLRIFLAQNENILPGDLIEIAGWNLTAYMVREGIPEPDLDEELGHYWKYRNLRDWMQAHQVLQAAYIEGKKIVNPSGRANEQ